MWCYRLQSLPGPSLWNEGGSQFKCYMQSGLGRGVCKMFMNLISVFIFCIVLWMTDRLYLTEGQSGGKRNSLCERWLKAVEPCLNSGSNVSKCVRYASIKYETLRTGSDSSGEDFQNKETFIVVRSSVFAKSSAQKTHLARDAYNAYWDSSRRSQERKCALGLWLKSGTSYNGL